MLSNLRPIPKFLLILSVVGDGIYGVTALNDKFGVAWNKNADKSKLHEITDDIKDKFKLL
jgi:hypothetical protein